MQQCNDLTIVEPISTDEAATCRTEDKLHFFTDNEEITDICIHSICFVSHMTGAPVK